MDFLSFVLNLERRLGLHVPEVDYPKLSNLQGCVDYFTPQMAAEAHVLAKAVSPLLGYW